MAGPAGQAGEQRIGPSCPGPSKSPSVTRLQDTDQLTESGRRMGLQGKKLGSLVFNRQSQPGSLVCAADARQSAKPTNGVVRGFGDEQSGEEGGVKAKRQRAWVRRRRRRRRRREIWECGETRDRQPDYSTSLRVTPGAVRTRGDQAHSF
jgi:hypothetical protein